MKKRIINIVMCNGRVLTGKDRKIHDNVKKEIAIFIQNKTPYRENITQINTPFKGAF